MKISDIKDPKFLKKYSIEELNTLCSEIREFVINNFSIDKMIEKHNYIYRT